MENKREKINTKPPQSILLQQYKETCIQMKSSSIRYERQIDIIEIEDLVRKY